MDSHGSALWPEEVHWLQFAACNPCGPAQPALLTLAPAFHLRRSAVLQLALTPLLLSGSVLAGVLSSALYAVSQRCHTCTYMAPLHSMRQQRRVVCATCSPFEVRSAFCVQVGISYYFYITFLGYSALPFLERTEVGRGGEAGWGADGRVESPCTWRGALHGEDWPMRHWQLPVAHTRTTCSPAPTRLRLLAGLPLPHRRRAPSAAFCGAAGVQPHAICHPTLFPQLTGRWAARAQVAAAPVKLCTFEQRRHCAGCAWEVPACIHSGRAGSTQTGHKHCCHPSRTFPPCSACWKLLPGYRPPSAPRRNLSLRHSLPQPHSLPSQRAAPVASRHCHSTLPCGSPASSRPP